MGLCLLLHSNERNATDSHRELSRLPPPFGDALARSGGLLFAIFQSLLLADLVTLVTAKL